VCWSAAGSGTIGGSGTDNYIPRFNGTNALENSLIYDDGTNIGIGTNAPDQYDATGRVLEVEYSGDGFPALRIERVSGSSKTNRAWETIIGSAGNYAIKDATVNGDRLSIDTSGKVGIGTVSPDDGLDVVGNIRISSNKTNATNKTSRLRAQHYTNAEEPVSMMFVNSFAATTGMYIGGSSTIENAVTEINLYTAANNTTTAGTKRMCISPSGIITSCGVHNVCTCLQSPILCGTSCVRGGYVHSTGYVYAGSCVCSSILCGTSQIKGVIVCGTTCMRTPLLCVNSSSTTAACLVRGATDGQVLQFWRGATASGNVSVTLNGIGIGGGTTEGSMCFHCTGKVGIGVASPKSLLSIDSNTAFNLVAGTSTGQDNILLHNNANGDGDGNYGPSIGFGGALDDSALNRRYAAIASVQTSSDNDQVGLAFITHPGSGSTDALVEQMRIKHDGKVGIGTTAPSKKLHISGTTGDNSRMRFTDTTNSTNFDVGTDSNGGFFSAIENKHILFYTNGSEKVRIENGGYVGIGDTDPDYKLSVKSADANLRMKIWGTASNSTSGIYFLSNNAGGTTIRDDRANQRFEFIGGTKYYFDNKVGIGTTAPHSALHVEGTPATTGGGDVAALLTIDNATASANGNQAGIIFNTNNAGTANAFITAEQDASNHGTLHFGGYNGNSNRATIMTVDAGAGMVGIGITNPGTELSVVGTVSAADSIFGAIMEHGLADPDIIEHEEGTVLVWEDGGLKPCEIEYDSRVMGISKKDHEAPIVIGAEPVLVTGIITEGDFIVTSEKTGHGKKGVSNNMFGKVIAQALEDGEGDSYKVRAMIRKF